jgi:hypothetical protein
LSARGIIKSGSPSRINSPDKWLFKIEQILFNEILSLLEKCGEERKKDTPIKMIVCMKIRTTVT